MNAEDIKKLKKRLKISTRAFADILDISTATCNRLMGGESGPKLRKNPEEKLEAIKSLLDDASVHPQNIKKFLLDPQGFLPPGITLRIHLNLLKKTASPSLFALEEFLHTCIGSLGKEIIASSLTPQLLKLLQTPEGEKHFPIEHQLQEWEKLLREAKETFAELEKAGAPMSPSYE